MLIQLQVWARFVLVDEFQDLNRTQVEILEHFCGGGTTSSTTKTNKTSSFLTVCGDPDQSIYGFRGALGIRGFTIIEQLYERQRAEQQRDMYKCELSENRRSLPRIVYASNAVIRANYEENTAAGKLGKKVLQMTPLLTKKKFKGLIEVRSYKNRHMEVNSVICMIEKMIDQNHKKCKDFCILSRTNFGLKEYENALSKKDIPWTVVGSRRTSETAARRGRSGSGGRGGGRGGGGGLKGKRKKKGKSALDHGVSLSTVHQAKGNEWPVVFIVNSTEGMMPMESAVVALEEERRIYYVAMTRAKEMLYMCWHRESSRDALDPSRFMQESGALDK